MTTQTDRPSVDSRFEALWAEAQAINLLATSGLWELDSIIDATVAHDWRLLRITAR